MIVQVLRMTAAALADATIGVNAKLAALDGGGYLGSDPVPASVVVTEPTADDFAAVASQPGSGPALSVMFVSLPNFTPHGIVAHRNGLMRVVVRYDDEQADASDLFRDCAHTMRAVLQSLAAWLRGGSGPTRELEGVQIVNAEEIWIAAPPELSTEATPVTFACYMELEVRDTIN